MRWSSFELVQEQHRGVEFVPVARIPLTSFHGWVDRWVVVDCALARRATEGSPRVQSLIGGRHFLSPLPPVFGGRGLVSLSTTSVQFAEKLFSIWSAVARHRFGILEWLWFRFVGNGHGKFG